jgi:hypothetical protein
MLKLTHMPRCNCCAAEQHLALPRSCHEPLQRREGQLTEPICGKSGMLQAAARQRRCTGVEQIRGFDLSDITFVGGKTGWIVFAALVKGSRSRAWQLFQDQVGQGLRLRRGAMTERCRTSHRLHQRCRA